MVELQVTPVLETGARMSVKVEILLPLPKIVLDKLKKV
jgi:hypothetical protein